jgi:hypothetical protein
MNNKKITAKAFKGKSNGEVSQLVKERVYGVGRK